MERKFRTTNQGVAAYLMMQNYDLVRTYVGKNRENKPCTFIELDVDQGTGKEMASAFYDGDVNGNLKEFQDKIYQVRKAIYDARK